MAIPGQHLSAAGRKCTGFGTAPEEALKDLFLEYDKGVYQKEVASDS